jgi:hypothetical protein
MYFLQRNIILTNFENLGNKKSSPAKLKKVPLISMYVDK